MARLRAFDDLKIELQDLVRREVHQAVLGLAFTRSDSTAPCTVSRLVDIGHELDARARIGQAAGRSFSHAHPAYCWSRTNMPSQVASNYRSIVKTRNVAAHARHCMPSQPQRSAVLPTPFFAPGASPTCGDFTRSCLRDPVSAGALPRMPSCHSDCTVDLVRHAAAVRMQAFTRGFLARRRVALRLVQLSPFLLPAVGTVVECTDSFETFDTAAKIVSPGTAGVVEKIDEDVQVRFAGLGLHWVGQEELHCLSQRLPLQPGCPLAGIVTQVKCYDGCHFAYIDCSGVMVFAGHRISQTLNIDDEVFMVVARDAIGQLHAAAHLPPAPGEVVRLP